MQLWQTMTTTTMLLAATDYTIEYRARGRPTFANLIAQHVRDCLPQIDRISLPIGQSRFVICLNRHGIILPISSCSRCCCCSTQSLLWRKHGGSCGGGNGGGGIGADSCPGRCPSSSSPIRCQWQAKPLLLPTAKFNLFPLRPCVGVVLITLIMLLINYLLLLLTENNRRLRIK